MKTATFNSLFVDQLKDIFSAEEQTLKGLTLLAKEAYDADLKEAFQHHHRETREQVARLKKIFLKLDESPEGTKCRGMEGLMKEALEIIRDAPKSLVRDAALITIAQKIEHYEIAAYGSARTFAKELDLDDVVDLLQQSLSEEANADRTLTKLAEGGLFSKGINQEAQEENPER